jgi:hypothetical protein
MDIPFSRWSPTIEKRRVCRNFDISQPIKPDKLSALNYGLRGEWQFLKVHHVATSSVLA